MLVALLTISDILLQNSTLNSILKHDVFGFGVFTAFAMKITFSWDMPPCSLVVHIRNAAAYSAIFMVKNRAKRQ
jgi:hypothetical protein